MLIFISKRNVEPPELRLVGDLREYNLRKLGLITLSLLPTKATVIRMLMLLKIIESTPKCAFLWTGGRRGEGLPEKQPESMQNHHRTYQVYFSGICVVYVEHTKGHCGPSKVFGDFGPTWMTERWDKEMFFTTYQKKLKEKRCEFLFPEWGSLGCLIE